MSSLLQAFQTLSQRLTKEISVKIDSMLASMSTMNGAFFKLRLTLASGCRQQVCERRGHSAWPTRGANSEITDMPHRPD